MGPRVSVIVPVYNGAATLPAAVAAVRGQTVTDWELLLIDDGSTDQTGPLCDRLAAADRRIRVFHLASRGGPGAARNRGLLAARGTYIWLLDGDDTAAPTLLTQALTAIETHGVHTVAWGVRQQGARPGPRCAPATVARGPEEVHRALLTLATHRLFGYGGNRLYHRETLAAAGLELPAEPLFETDLFNVAYAPHIPSLAVLPTASLCCTVRPEGELGRLRPDYFPLAYERLAARWGLWERWGLQAEAADPFARAYGTGIFAALCRRCDRRGEGGGRAFLEEQYADPLFLATLARYEGAHRRCRLLAQHRTGLCLAAARGDYLACHRGRDGYFERE